MSWCEEDSAGGPRIVVDPKRSFDEIPIRFDWHDYLANLPERGNAYALNARVRPRRANATGLEYQATTAGTTGRREPRWPTALGGTVPDGSVVWTAVALSTASLRTTISSQSAPAVTGVTVGAPTLDDLAYTVLVSGGTSGQTYEIKHQVTLANGEEKEAVAVLLVQD
jgi:hypothetical protein